MLFRFTTERILERVVAVHDIHGLRNLALASLDWLSLAAFEISLVREGGHEVLVRAGERLPPPATVASASAVREGEGVWQFSLGDDDPTLGWLRVRLLLAPSAETLECLQQLSRWLRGPVGYVLEHRRLCELERQVAVLRVQTREAERLKEEFLSNLNHELRTPLTSILGFSEILLESSAAATWQEDCARRIHESGERLLKLLNRLLQLAKTEAERLNVQLVRSEPRGIIESVVGEVVKQAEAKALSMVMRLEALPLVTTDPNHLREALLCVLENAVKFTDVGGIELRARCDAANLHINIADTGRGIATHDLPFVFDAFWQGDGSMTRAVGGNGIGLALAHRLVTRLGGEIRIESDVGTGTTVHIRIPREPASASTKPRRHTPRQYGLPFAAGNTGEPKQTDFDPAAIQPQL